MKPNCIIIYGVTHQTGFKHAGPFRIATELRNHGYTVQCVDFTMFEGNSKLFFDVISHLISENTLWLGISNTFIYSRSTQELLKPQSPLTNFLVKFKETFPNIKLITGGGGYLNYYRKHGFKIFKNYADTEIVEYTDWCSKRKNTYKFLVPEIEGQEFKEFNQSQILYEDNDIIFPTDGLPIEISRGCIFSCKYCSFKLNGKNKDDHVKSYNVLYDELIRNYEKFGVTSYMFADDTYNDSVNKVKGLYDNVFSKLPFKMQFTTYLRLDLIMRFPETAEYLKESGLASGCFGVETINHQSAKAVGKGGIPPKEQFEYVRQLKQNEFKDIIVGSGFILGLPYDTIDTLEETKEFILSDKNPFDAFFMLPLNISPLKMPNNVSGRELLDQQEKDNYSYLDKNYKEYDYEIDDVGVWINKRTNLTYAICDDYTKLILSRAREEGRIKAGEFDLLYYQSLGVPLEKLLTIPVSSATFAREFDIPNKIISYKKKYIKKLLDVINFSKPIDS
jgi:hypothetical protein